jgi:hypothetical protein
MKNNIISFASVTLFSVIISFALVKGVQRADNICSSYAINNEQYRSCLGI